MRLEALFRTEDEVGRCSEGKMRLEALFRTEDEVGSVVRKADIILVCTGEKNPKRKRAVPL